MRSKKIAFSRFRHTHTHTCMQAHTHTHTDRQTHAIQQLVLPPSEHKLSRALVHMNTEDRTQPTLSCSPELLALALA